MRHGDIYWVNLDLAQGSESNKKRPCLIVSRDEANNYVASTGKGTITILPITSNTRFVAPFQVFLPALESGLNQDSKVQAEQIRTVSVERIGDYIGSV